MPNESPGMTSYLKLIVTVCLSGTLFKILAVLGICSFQDQYYLQLHDSAMRSPVLQIVCNLYNMEDFERRTLESAVKHELLEMVHR